MSIRLALCAAAVVAVAAFAPSVAGADPTEGPGAIIGSATENVAETQGFVGDTAGQGIKLFDGEGPNISCDASAAGGAVTPEQGFVVGKIFAQDAGVGHGECIDIAGGSFSMTVKVTIQTLHGGFWVDVPGCSRSSSASSTRGVAVAQAEVVCNFGEVSPYLDEYHRTRTVVTNSRTTDTRSKNSTPWYQRHG